jgi:hypothetical protein
VYNAVILKRDPAHAVPAAVAPLIVKALKRDTVNDVTPAPNSHVHGVTRHLEKLGAVRVLHPVAVPVASESEADQDPWAATAGRHRDGASGG